MKDHTDIVGQLERCFLTNQLTSGIILMWNYRYIAAGGIAAGEGGGGTNSCNHMASDIRSNLCYHKNLTIIFRSWVQVRMLKTYEEKSFSYLVYMQVIYITLIYFCCLSIPLIRIYTDKINRTYILDWQFLGLYKTGSLECNTHLTCLLMYSNSLACTFKSQLLAI